MGENHREGSKLLMPFVHGEARVFQRRKVLFFKKIHAQINFQPLIVIQRIEVLLWQIFIFADTETAVPGFHNNSPGGGQMDLTSAAETVINCDPVRRG